MPYFHGGEPNLTVGDDLWRASELGPVFNYDNAALSGTAAYNRNIFYFTSHLGVAGLRGAVLNCQRPTHTGNGLRDRTSTPCAPRSRLRRRGTRPIPHDQTCTRHIGGRSRHTTITAIAKTQQAWLYEHLELGTDSAHQTLDIGTPNAGEQLKMSLRQNALYHRRTSTASNGRSAGAGDHTIQPRGGRRIVATHP